MKKQAALTEGPILRQLVGFFLPIAAGTIFQQLYNAVDTLVVGRFVGTVALAAVGGSTARIVDLLIGVCVALANGAAVVISHLYGAREYDRARKAIHTAYLFCACLGLALSLFVIVLTPQLLALLRTPAEIIPLGTVYQRTVFSSAMFLLVYNMGSAILRAMGNSRFPFFCLLFTCALNSVLDVLFVAGLHMGVAGAAWATVIAQVVSSILVTVKLMRGDAAVRLSLREIRIHRGILRRMMSIGIPAGLQTGMYSASNIILQVAINTLGTVVVASWSMSSKVDGVFWAVSGAFSSAICTFVGQNYGAGKMERVRTCIRQGLRLFLVITVVLCALILLAAQPLLHLFTSDPEVIACTWQIVLFFVPTYFLWSIIDTLSGSLRGLGDTLMPTVITGLAICVFRVVWVFTVFAAFPTLTVICLCYPISWLLGDIGICLHFRKSRVLSEVNASTA